jgi:hypothetical protein
MLDRSNPWFARPARFVAPAGAAMVALTIAVGHALCQNASPPAAPGAQQAAPDQPAVAPSEAAPPTHPPAQANPPAPPENRGLINEIGKMFDKLPAWKSPGATIDDLNARARDAAKDATDTLSRLATPSMVTGRLACPMSANGAPDCKAAADKLCQGKGFKEGKSLATDAAEACSAKVLIPGRTRKPDDCRTDTYVTRAYCQ